MEAHRRRYSLRFHFGLIVLFCLGSGLAGNELLRVLAGAAPILRWPLAVLGAGAGLLAAVALWRAYVLRLVRRGAISSLAGLNQPPRRFAGAWEVGSSLTSTGGDDIVSLILILALYAVSWVLWLPASLLMYALTRGSLTLFDAVFPEDPAGPRGSASRVEAPAWMASTLRAASPALAVLLLLAAGGALLGARVCPEMDGLPDLLRCAAKASPRAHSFFKLEGTGSAGSACNGICIRLCGARASGIAAPG